MTRWWARARRIPGRDAGGIVVVDPAEWLAAATDAAAAGGQLVALWASPQFSPTSAARIRAAILIDGGLLILELPIPDVARPYRGLQDLFPSATRMQRAAADLAGVRSDAPDQRSWIRHGAWSADEYPLARVPGSPAPDAVPVDDYAFVRVTGDGVHEIPVGPVHAGIIEPGHFRFSVVGEKVLRLEQHLGYVHKGIEQRFTQLPAIEGHRLAARISGDTAVGYAWAYCQALEGISAVTAPMRAQWLRGICLELERLQNHLGDLGALGNDAGFAFGLAQFSRLKEELLRAMAATLGQRYLMDAIVPGGVSVDLTDAAAEQLGAHVLHTALRVRELRSIYDNHAGVRDRFAGAGTVTPELARRLGLTGLAGRASAQPADLRVDAPCAPYHVLTPRRCMRRDGDVAARVAMRFDEVDESCRLLGALLSELPAGPLRAPLSVPDDPRFGIGMIEAWRGCVLIALETGEGGRILRCHAHDPSWQNWLVLEYAIIGNIVPDFPLINKSFNLSYSGHDL